MHQQVAASWIAACALGFYAFGGAVFAAEVAAPPEHSATTPTAQDSPPWMPREMWEGLHDGFNEIAKKNASPLVFLGDSITQGWKDSGAPVWEKHYASRHAANFGIGGDRTEHVLWRIDHGNFDGFTPKLIVLMIGTNNLNKGDTPEQTTDGVTAIVQRLREKTPESTILLLGIFPRAKKADNPFREQVAATNQAIAKLADWEKVHYLDIGHVFLEKDGAISKEIMPDFLHLSEEGYRRWADAIEFKIKELLGEDDEKHSMLFDGRSLDGWVNDDGKVPQGWKVADGHLKITDSGDDAQTNELYSNFDLQCEWRLERPGGNSGIFYRWADYKVNYLGRRLFVGPEYQLVDDLGRGIRPGRVDATGANLDMYGPKADKPVREQGQWNHSRIVARGNHVEHWLNGVRVLAYRVDSPEWKRRLARSKFARLTNFGQYHDGTIRLQNQSGMPASYRDIQIRRLDRPDPHVVARPST
jgi:lysophospholipase L1-like esterase